MEKKQKKTYLQITYVNSARFMASSLSNLVNNFVEEIRETKCNYGHDNKKCETCGIKYKDCECYLEYIIFKNDLIEYKCSCLYQNYKRKFDAFLNKRFTNTYKFSII